MRHSLKEIRSVLGDFQGSRRAPNRAETDIVKEVLAAGGYLSSAETARLSAFALSERLSRFQDFHGLEQTGKLDDATAEAMMNSRCALPDPNPLAASTVCGWQTPVVRYAFGNGTSQVSGSGEFEAARRAFRTMSRSGAPTLVEVDDSDPDLQMLVSWTAADCADSDMTGTTLAHADYPPDCPFFDAALPQPIHVDDEEHNWVTGASIDDHDIETVMLHEVGHIVGLAHSSVSGAVMQSIIPDNFTNRDLHDDDLVGISSIYRGRSHIQRIGDGGTISSRTDTNLWTAGWSMVQTFQVGSQAFLFLLKHGTGDVHIHELDDDGTVGARVYDKHWTNWWSTAEFYEVGGSTYLFLLKERSRGADGNNVHIHEMNSNGTVGDRVQSLEWTEGWTTAEFYEVGGSTYLFLLKERGAGSDGNNVHIHEMNGNGTVGARVESLEWTGGWTTAEFYEVDGATYLFLLKERGTGSDGNNVHIHEMNSDGSVGARVESLRWTGGWTTVEFYEADGDTYLFLLKVAGAGGDGNNVHTHEMTSTGKVGSAVQSKSWSEGWTSAQFSDTGSNTHLILVKSCDIK